MAHSGRFVALSFAMVLLLSLAACSKDSKKPAAASAQPSSSSLPSSSSSASLASSPTSASSSADPCNASAPPKSAVNVTHADADYNGDGTTDTLTVYGTGTTDQPSPYHAQIELGGAKGTIDTVINDAATDNNQVVKALGETTSPRAPGSHQTARARKHSSRSAPEHPTRWSACSNSSVAHSRGSPDRRAPSFRSSPSAAASRISTGCAATARRAANGSFSCRPPAATVRPTKRRRRACKCNPARSLRSERRSPTPSTATIRNYRHSARSIALACKRPSLSTTVEYPDRPQAAFEMMLDCVRRQMFHVDGRG